VSNQECQRCGAKSIDAFLCRLHATDLKRHLSELAGSLDIKTGRATTGWIENLADSAQGQARIGRDNGRRSRSDSEAPLRFNEKASTLLRQVHGTLARWVQDLCESRGVEYRPVKFVRLDLVGPLRIQELRGVRYSSHGADLALWLEIHVAAILGSEDAGMCLDELESSIGAIKAAVDRPPDMREVGECPSHLDDGTICANYLRADRDAVEVTCPECGVSHNVDRVVDASLSRADHMPWTSEAIMEIVDQHGLRLSPRTWRDWRKMGVVKPCLWQRADGSIGIGKQNLDDVPLYRLSDVRMAMAKKGERGRREVA